MTWDQLTVFGLGALAAAYLLRGLFTRKRGCGGCAACPSDPRPALVQIEPGPARPRKRPGDAAPNGGAE